MNRDYIKKEQGCSCVDVATMTSAGADDDATMGKAESLIPSCVQQCLVSQLLIAYVCVGVTAHFASAVEGLLAALFRLSKSSLCDMVHTSSFQL
ncbi:hypothetical protein OXX69_010640 [Metschnikowia pulcherrima]